MDDAEPGATSVTSIELARDSHAIGFVCDSTNTVVSIDDSCRAQLSLGDRIIAVDDRPLAGLPLEDVLGTSSHNHRLLVVRRAAWEENLLAAFALWSSYSHYERRVGACVRRWLAVRHRLARSRRTLGDTFAAWLIWRRHWRAFVRRRDSVFRFQLKASRSATFSRWRRVGPELARALASTAASLRAWRATALRISCNLWRQRSLDCSSLALRKRVGHRRTVLRALRCACALWQAAHSQSKWASTKARSTWRRAMLRAAHTRWSWCSNTRSHALRAWRRASLGRACCHWSAYASTHGRAVLHVDVLRGRLGRRRLFAALAGWRQIARDAAMLAATLLLVCAPTPSHASAQSPTCVQRAVLLRTSLRQWQRRGASSTVLEECCRMLHCIRRQRARQHCWQSLRACTAWRARVAHCSATTELSSRSRALRTGLHAMRSQLRGQAQVQDASRRCRRVALRAGFHWLRSAMGALQVAAADRHHAHFAIRAIHRLHLHRATGHWQQRTLALQDQHHLLHRSQWLGRRATLLRGLLYWCRCARARLEAAARMHDRMQDHRIVAAVQSPSVAQAFVNWASSAATASSALDEAARLQICLSRLRALRKWALTAAQRIAEAEAECEAAALGDLSRARAERRTCCRSLRLWLSEALRMGRACRCARLRPALGHWRCASGWDDSAIRAAAVARVRRLELRASVHWALALARQFLTRWQLRLTLASKHRLLACHACEAMTHRRMALCLLLLQAWSISQITVSIHEHAASRLAWHTRTRRALANWIAHGIENTKHAATMSIWDGRRRSRMLAVTLRIWSIHIASLSCTPHAALALQHTFSRWLRRRAQVANEATRHLLRVTLRRTFDRMRRSVAILGCLRAASAMVVATTWRLGASKALLCLQLWKERIRSLETKSSLASRAWTAIAHRRAWTALTCSAGQAMLVSVAKYRCRRLRLGNSLRRLRTCTRRVRDTKLLVAGIEGRIPLTRMLCLARRWMRRRAEALAHRVSMVFARSLFRRRAQRRVLWLWRHGIVHCQVVSRWQDRAVAARSAISLRRWCRACQQARSRCLVEQAVHRHRGLRALARNSLSRQRSSRLLSSAIEAAPHLYLRAAIRRFRTRMRKARLASTALSAAGGRHLRALAPSKALLRWQVYAFNKMRRTHAHDVLRARLLVGAVRGALDCLVWWAHVASRTTRLVETRSTIAIVRAFRLWGHLGITAQCFLRAVVSGRAGWRRRRLSAAMVAIRAYARQSLAPTAGHLRSIAMALARWTDAVHFVMRHRMADAHTSELWQRHRCRRLRRTALARWRLRHGRLSTGVCRDEAIYGLQAKSLRAKRRGALHQWQELAVRRRVGHRLVAMDRREGLLGRVRWWAWWSHAMARAQSLYAYALSVWRIVHLREASHRWRVYLRAEASARQCVHLVQQRTCSRAWEQLLACTVRALRRTRDQEAADQCARQQALVRGCLQLARQCVRQTRMSVLWQLANEALARRSLSCWVHTSRCARRCAPADARAMALWRAGVASRFWRLRSLFMAFARLVVRAATGHVS